MTALRWTTTGTVLRVPDDPTRDPYDAPPAAVEVDAGHPAHVDVASGSERVAGGAQEVVEYRLYAQAGTDLAHTDQWRDDTTGVVYDVEWVHERVHPRLGYVEAGLRKVTGVA